MLDPRISLSEMETETKNLKMEESNGRKVFNGIVAGIIGGAVMGGMMSMMMPAAINKMIPALFGLQGTAAGWGVHIFNSAIFGIVFAGILSVGAFRKMSESSGKTFGLGVIYGFLVWVGPAAIVMPIWLNTVAGMNAPVPNVVPKSIVAHIVFGIVLGVVYTALDKR
ncbi:MAG: histidine kinase [Halobacteria archaeon]